MEEEEESSFSELTEAENMESPGELAEEPEAWKVVDGLILSCINLAASRE